MGIFGNNDGYSRGGSSLVRFAIPAMLQSAVAVTSARTTAHHENARCGFVVDTVALPLDPAVEPSPSQGEEILGQIAVDNRRRAELDLAGMAQ